MFTSLYTNWIRGIRKRGGYFILNLAGLAIGFASFLFITLYVVNELTYDRFHINYQNIYRLKVVGVMAGGKLDQAVTAAPMAQAMKNDYPEVVEVTRVRQMGDWLIKVGDRKFNESGILFADSTFFSVLDFRMIKGDPKSALVRPQSIVLTEEYARKYFGETDPMGQRMNVESDTVFYTVTGVIQDVPQNSHIRFDMLASMSTYPRLANNTIWVSHNFYTYIVAKDGTNKDQLQTKFQDMVIKYVGPQLTQILGVTVEDFRKAGNEFSYVVEPLKDIHLKGATQYNLEPPGSLTTVYIFAVIALLILVIAIINYINLATAKSAARAKEVAVRKVSGANKSGLVAQFLSESMVIVAFAAIVSVLIVLALIPAFNDMIGKELSLRLIWNIPGIVSMILVVILVGLISGSYPAFVLASFNPVEVLKGTMSPGSMSRKMRAVLVVFQFTVSIIIIIGSIIVYSQLNFMARKDLGFNKENLLVIRRADAFWRQMESFRTQLLEIPGVEKVGFSRNVPGLTSFSNNAFFNDNDPEKKTYLINQGVVSFDFPEALGVQLAAGRFFSREYGTDSSGVLINEAAVNSLGLTDPVGKYILQPAGPGQFQRMQIIGVMKDFNIESMHKAITPVCFTVNRGGGGDQFVTVRLTGNDLPGTIDAIRNLWEEYTPDMPFQLEFFKYTWENLYTSELRTGKIFLIFSALAIFIACLGLIGLVTYITNKRTREIGIRKSYGATGQSVLVLLSREVVVLILVSSLLAWPVAYFGSGYWLEGFASRIPVNPLVYILATILTLAVGWLSISYQTIKASNYNPATALRME